MTRQENLEVYSLFSVRVLLLWLMAGIRYHTNISYLTVYLISVTDQDMGTWNERTAGTATIIYGPCCHYVMFEGR